VLHQRIGALALGYEDFTITTGCGWIFERRESHVRSYCRPSREFLNILDNVLEEGIGIYGADHALAAGPMQLSRPTVASTRKQKIKIFAAYSVNRKAFNGTPMKGVEPTLSAPQGGLPFSLCITKRALSRFASTLSICSIGGNSC
jgi:hypothetical protein